MVDQDRADLILEIDSFFNPINTEILNQYSISWEKRLLCKNRASGIVGSADPGI